MRELIEFGSELVEIGEGVCDLVETPSLSIGNSRVLRFSKWTLKSGTDLVRSRRSKVALMSRDSRLDSGTDCGRSSLTRSTDCARDFFRHGLNSESAESVCLLINEAGTDFGLSGLSYCVAGLADFSVLVFGELGGNGMISSWS